MNTQLRKAAILVASLDKASAEALLAQMPKATAHRVLAAARQLGSIDPLEQQEVLSEFARQSGKPAPPSPAPASSPTQLSSPASFPAPAASAPAGVELELSESAVMAPAAPSSLARPPHKTTAPQRFAYITAELVEPLAAILAREQPQLAALILAHLPAERSAAVLALLGAEHRLPIVQRIAEIEEAATEVLDALEAELQPRLMRERLQVEGSQQGLAALSGILQASDFELRQQISSAIGARKAAKTAAPLAAPPDEASEATPRGSMTLSDAPQAPPPREGAPSPPQDPPIAFAALSELDDVSLAAVFGAVTPQIAILALVGAEESLVRRILRILPRKEAALFQRRLEEVGPLRLKEVELAQAKMSHAAGDLLQQRRITLPSTQRVRLAA